MTLPEPIAVEAKQRNRLTRCGAAGAADVAIGVPGDPVARLGDGDGGNGFHEPLRTATLRYAVACARGERVRDDAALRDGLRAAILAAPRRAGRSLAEVAQYAADAELDRLIAGAFAWVARQKRDGGQAMAPRHAMPRHSIDAACAETRRAVTGLLRRVQAHARLERGDADGARPAWMRPPRDPLRLAPAVTVGGGKSAVTRQELGGFIREMVTAALPWRVLVTVPEHQLSRGAHAGLCAVGGLARARRRRPAWRRRDDVPQPRRGEGRGKRRRRR